MLRQQAKLFNKLSMWADVFVICVALVLAYHVRTLFQGWLLPLRNYLWVLVVVLPVWFYLLNRHGLYASIRRLSVWDIVSKLVHVHVLGGLLTASVIFFVDRDRYSRGLYLVFLGTSFLLLSLEKVGVRLALGFSRRRGFNIRNLLIVGTREKARKFHHLIGDHADWGLKIIGYVQADDAVSVDEIEGHRVLGHIGDLNALCKSNSVDEVIFCISKDMVVRAEDLLLDLQELGVTVRMVLDFYDMPRCKMDIGFLHDTLPVLTFHTKSLDAQQLFLKRILDILGALCGLTILILLFPFIALAIKLGSKGPIFFGQERVGESGRIFKCWKFRSMYMDAEERKKDLLDQNEMNGAIFKIKNDPRITKVGRFLRKTSLDEFPQFWNVLRGDMSLVGTRPPTPDEVAQYENWHHRRISIKPGITGMWQTSGRNRIDDFDEIVRLDLCYIDKWTIWLDIVILLKTVRAVFAGSGSY
jgi:exopolysaccharide biosynthesis polyprenyl glycosylphosphotransferase